MAYNEIFLAFGMIIIPYKILVKIDTLFFCVIRAFGCTLTISSVFCIQIGLKQFKGDYLKIFVIKPL
jgi:hypothetical protein